MNRVWVRMEVNGTPVTLEVEPHERLVDVLRTRLGLTGTKEGCGQGECGSCTVLLNGQPVDSCLVLAAEAHGAHVVTIEGLGDAARAIQAAFVEEGAVHCGFCTPGFVVSVYALLCRSRNPSEEEVRHALEGNLCRCTGYAPIVRAVRRAAREWGERA